MIYLGRNIADKGVVTQFHDCEEQIQPSGVDLTLNNIYSISSKGVVGVSNDQRVIADYTLKQWDNDYIHLLPGPYIFEFNEMVNTPKDSANSIYPRSTLVRNAVSLHSGLFDAGYKGPISSLIIVHNPFGVTFYKNARVAQLKCEFMESEHETGYQGKYQQADLRGEGGKENV